MTATQVDGTAVLCDEPTEAPITDKTGKPLVWTQTRTLLLADGRTVYGCQHCDYTHPSVGGIRPHLRVHKPAKPKPSNGAGDMSVAELVALASKAGTVVRERDEWKARALKAERELATVRRVLGGS